MRSQATIIWHMLRRHLTSPYIFLWRTVELLAIIRLAREHGCDLTGQLDLDAGCGNGIVGQAVGARIGAGIDSTARQLAWARREPAYQSLLQASLTAIPLRDRSQRAVLCNSVMEHIRDDAAALGELARVLAPGGYLLLTLASRDLYRAAFGADAVPPALRRELDASLAHEHYYDAAGIRRRLEALGLEVLAAEPYMAPRQARRWIRLRTYQSRQPQRGLRGRLAQLGRIPLTLATLPLLWPTLASPEVGAGLAVVARRLRAYPDTLEREGFQGKAAPSPDPAPRYSDRRWAFGRRA
ncbi:MAG TPA: class I SAM-dependent methyltransferase [Roseiflexaceae bacterium]|nr:class I SAM-dependent methyltransferase [Roseiflexaceae bacterium]